MKLNTGKVAFPIEFDNGDVQNIYFNPNDPDLAVRMKDFRRKVEERTKNIDDLQLKPDGSAEDEEKIEVIREIQNILCEELDAAFDSPVSAVVFKYCSPFAAVNGDFFVMHFLSSLPPSLPSPLPPSPSSFSPPLPPPLSPYVTK